MSKKENEQKGEIVWRAAEFEYREKDVGWYWIFGTGAAIFAMFALWQKNFFFFIFVVIAGAMVLVIGRRKPRVFEFKITDKGVGIGSGIFYRFDTLLGFDINNRPGRLDEIVLKRKTFLNSYVKIPIDSSLAKEARLFLEERITRFEYEESLIEVLADWLGF